MIAHASVLACSIFAFAAQGARFTPSFAQIVTAEEDGKDKLAAPTKETSREQKMKMRSFAVSISCGEASATSLSLSCTVDARSYDLISFELFVTNASSSSAKRPSLISYTVGVASNGSASGEVAGLFPNMDYSVTARAHLKDEAQGNPTAWTSISNEIVHCSTFGTVFPRVDHPLTNPNSMWLEVFRYNDITELPDYLDGHNGADATAMETSVLPMFYNPPSNFTKGISGKVTKKLVKRGGVWALLCKIGWKCKRGRSIVTRYCVEIEKASLQNPLFSNVGSTDSAFAPYRPCNGGLCPCSVKTQFITPSRPLPDAMKDKCGISHCELCEGDEAKRVGALPWPLPIPSQVSVFFHAVRLTKQPPMPFNKSVPYGTWYSFPAEGFCPFGQKIGSESCTWRLHPLSHTARVDQFIENGLDTGGSAMRGVPLDVSLRNANKVRSFFDDVSPCGKSH